MDRPLGPRQPPPDKRHAAYEDIFGRPSVVHQQHLAPQQPYPRPQQHPPYDYRVQYQPYPQQQPYPHPRSLNPYPANQGVLVPTPDGPVAGSNGLTPAQAYQAQIYRGDNQSTPQFRSPPPQPQQPGPLSVTIEADEGRLGIDFDQQDNGSELPWARREWVSSW
ncbi:hypothetical protein C8J57DRAFT_1276544 [Mycena rebaudengoi]|nr:hypothetical protein C8J57DRAFT_1276544 [Mycena rebaudengoi]